jgi:uncharacterized protein YdhG (YjbR/CyaY superfamily)
MPEKKSKGFTPEEKEAMREHVRELKRQRTSAGKEDDERAVLEKIAAMPQPDRSMAERIHALVKASAPELSARLWYGMPAYTKDDKVICFFQNAQKFKTRYSTFGFQDKATLDEGNMWPIGFALKQLGAADEARIADLLKRATR